jgi:hypothetical protein
MMPDLNQLLGTMLYRDLREEIKVLVYILYTDCIFNAVERKSFKGTYPWTN